MAHNVARKRAIERDVMQMNLSQISGLGLQCKGVARDMRHELMQPRVARESLPRRVVARIVRDGVSAISSAVEAR